MSRAQFVVAFLVSALIALLPLTLVAWIMSESWSPVHVQLIGLVLVFPMIGAMKLDLSHAFALLFCFFIYWLSIFTALWWCIKTTGLEIKLFKRV